MTTAFVERFGLAGPLVVAPLGGGPTTPALVAATCNAGALGSLAGAYLAPPELEQAIAKTRALTAKPFVVNLFAPLPVPTVPEAQVRRAVEATKDDRAKLGLAATPEVKPPYHENFDEQFRVVLAAKPAAFSFTFGLVSPSVLEACRQAGIYTFGQATTQREAEALETFGVDAIILQGTEAGGHRSMFSDHDPEPDLGIEDLLRTCFGLVRRPLIASGGLMSRDDIARVMRLGAEAAQLGTAFLLCPEAGTSAPYREALRHPTETRLTRAFSGRLARGMENYFLRKMSEQPEAILPWPAQNRFTRDLRQASARAGSPEFLSLWAGTGVRQIQEKPAADIVRGLLGS